MSTSPRFKILAIGHSYVVAMNRALLREVAADPVFDVTIAAPDRFPSDLGTIECQPEPPDSPLRLVQVKIHWSRWIYTFGYDTKHLRRLMDENAFDLVYAWEEPYIYAGYQIARLLRRETAYSFRTAQSLPKRYPLPFSHFERVCLERADGWVAGAHLVYENSVKRGYPAHKGKIITLAVDTSAFRPMSENEREAVRSELGLKPPTIGYLGRLTTAKGIDVMLRAIELLEPDRPWSLLVLGSGPSQSTIDQWARSNGWSDRVRVRLVPHNDVPRYLPVMDLLLTPSLTTRGWKEQFGRMVIEAFACGVPVISSDSGELPYVIGDAGWVVQEGKPAALADAIKAALDAPVERQKMVQKGLGRVGDYSTRTIADQVRDFYRTLIERKQKTLRAA